MTVVTVIATAMLLLAALLAAIHALRPGKVLADRAVALDLAVIVALNGLALRAATAKDSSAVVLLLVFGVVGFITIVTVARFIERRGS
jgi:multicomponent Na+:H+ antiporter subunit F